MLLNCEIVGGNPLASITWICEGLSHVTSNSNFTDKVVSRIELNVTRYSDGKECICRGQHLLWEDGKEKSHTLIVYCK